ncbi:innexin unc-9-like [Dreissena polymorpha]|uniref:Innexin n=1 Tax=Dreissena polymorpha TaxID=45954 RepID=A0A9D4DGW0_DREPO|nr:innexin unc-9-like [Dreissena polymorpha]KAH3747862.1 hypothetical protein DPMN_182296 [Dreissena polymorpha]
MGNGLCVETSSSWTVFDWLDKVLGSVGSYAGLVKLRHDDDFIDRLSHHYTTMLLVIFTIVVSTKQYVGDAIQCWCPAQFTEAQVHYANQICWVSNTYHIPMETVIPESVDSRKEKQLTYYQWVPFILLMMALLFKLPRVAWKVLTFSHSISIDQFVSMVWSLQLAAKTERDVKLAEMTDYLESWLSTAEHNRSSCCLPAKQKVAKYSCLVCGRRYGNVFITACLVVKGLYAFNAFLHFFALNAFLGRDFAGWGFEIISGLADENPEYLKASPRFPRVTLCDFEIRQMSNLHRWTVQCVLPINLFNSKIFLFIWFWLLFLAVVSFLSLGTTIYASMFPHNRVEFIRKYMIMRKVILQRGGENRTVNKFVMSYLKFDGVFVLRVAAHNATEVLTGQLIENLYNKYKTTMHTEVKQNSVPGEYV